MFLFRYLFGGWFHQRNRTRLPTQWALDSFHDNQLVNPMAKSAGHHLTSLTLTKLSPESGIFTQRSFRSEKGARGSRTRQGETPHESMGNEKCILLRSACFSFLVAVHIFVVEKLPSHSYGKWHIMAHLWMIYDDLPTIWI